MSVWSRPLPWGECKHLFVLWRPKRCRSCGKVL